jgi:hypothetical protein
MSPSEAFGIALILLGCSAPIIVIGIVYIIKKRLEHKQIMAAIEKGTPLSELRPAQQNGSLWTRNVAMGIGLLVIGIGWVFVMPGGGPYVLVALILVGIGIARIIRGVLNRKYDAQSQPSVKNGAAQGRHPAGISAPGTLQQ